VIDHVLFRGQEMRRSNGEEGGEAIKLQTLWECAGKCTASVLSVKDDDGDDRVCELVRLPEATIRVLRACD
jgi:hypothetical protein